MQFLGRAAWWFMQIPLSEETGSGETKRPLSRPGVRWAFLG